MSTLELNILDQLNNLIIVINPDTSIDYVSPSVKDLLGFEADLLLGDGWWKYTKETFEQAEAIKGQMLSLFGETSLSNEFEREVISASGETKWILWKMSELNEGKLVGVGHDITKRKLLEQQVEEQKLLIEERSKEVLDSIEYASSIQLSLLPRIEEARNLYSDAFLIYKPKDLVSGDFYWQFYTDNKIVTAIIDCTGHGVPGALVTIMANAAFNDIVQRQGIFEPEDILYKLDNYITKTLNERSSITRLEGMDVSICTYEKKNNRIKYAGAYRPLYLVRNNELIVYEGDKNPIGYHFGLKKSFNAEIINLKKGDTLYMFSDGYTDQFGGRNVKKFNRKRFRNLLLSIQEYDLKRQQKELELAFDSWKGKSEQIDDVSVLGLRV